MLRRSSWLLRVGLIGHLTAVLMVLLAVAMVPSLLLAVHDEAPDKWGHIWAAAGTAGLGLLLFGLTRKSPRQIAIGHREGFLIVAVGWWVAGLVGALPYWLYAHLAPGDLCAGGGGVGSDFCAFTSAAFESISGFTTTGASIINEGLWGSTPRLTPDGVPGLPRGILLWRSITHYLGGMGIIVLGVAILPLLGVGGMQLMKAEVPGPTTDKLAPRVGETAKLLWKVYLLFSLVMFVLLSAGGMTAFESICHTMATMATGGFSTRAASVAGFDNGYIEWIITIFMWVAGMNFTLHFIALRGRRTAYTKDPEWRAYTAICVLATGAVTIALLGSGEFSDALEALRIAAFQVLSIITTTGYASFDFELWTYAPVALLVMVALMFVGGCAGSTGGGFKVVRHVLVTKVWVRELFLLSHPHAVRPVRLGGRAISPDVLRAMFGFAGAYAALVMFGTAFFAVDGQDVLTAFTAAASSLGNIGPGLGAVGPYDNYAGLSAASKWVSMLLMIMGRLEIYTLLVLLSPAFWRR